MQRKPENETRFYPFTNQFTFSMVMRDPSAHGVRFDALMNDTKRWADIEMQTYEDDDIGKRSRYYLGNVDMDALAKGRPYSDLPPTYVIFICTYDYMGEGKPVYFFQHYDVKNNLPLDDEAYIIILNTKCNPTLVPEQLKPLYAYINDPDRIEDEFIQQLDERVQQYNSTEWRRVQVTLEHMLMDKEKRDIEKGRAEGRAEERERVNMLFDKLFELGRFEDAQKAAKDADYQAVLFQEFEL